MWGIVCGDILEVKGSDGSCFLVFERNFVFSGECIWFDKWGGVVFCVGIGIYCLVVVGICEYRVVMS